MAEYLDRKGRVHSSSWSRDQANRRFSEEDDRLRRASLKIEAISADGIWRQNQLLEEQNKILLMTPEEKAAYRQAHMTPAEKAAAQKEAEKEEFRRKMEIISQAGQSELDRIASRTPQERAVYERKLAEEMEWRRRSEEEARSARLRPQAAQESKAADELKAKADAELKSDALKSLEAMRSEMRQKFEVERKKADLAAAKKLEKWRAKHSQ